MANHATHQLQAMGQSLWLEDVSLLGSGRLLRYLTDFSVTGLTFNLETFEQAISASDAYRTRIRTLNADGFVDDSLYSELTIVDIQDAADSLRSNFEASSGVDGWVCQQLPPLLSCDAAWSVRAAARLHKRAARPNLMIGVPGAREGLLATEQLIYDGIPVNVSWLFS